MKPGMEELFTSASAFSYVPTLRIKTVGSPLPTMPEMPTILSVWKNAASNAGSLSSSTNGDEMASGSGGNTCITTDPEMESSMEDDSSMEEHYFRLPEPLTSSVSDVCYDGN